VANVLYTVRPDALLKEAQSIETSAKESQKSWIILGQLDKYDEALKTASLLRRAAAEKSVYTRREILRNAGYTVKSPKALSQNPRPRKYASDAERQAAFRNRASMLEFRADEKTAEKLTEIADTLDISRSDLLLSMVKFALTNHQWARFGLTHKTLPRYEENPIMATKKFSPAQIAAQKLFAERARAGTLGRGTKRKANPAKKTVSGKISQLVHEGYPQKQAIAIALSEQRAGKVKRNPEGRSVFNLGGGYFGSVSMSGYNEYYAQIFYRTTDSSGFTDDQIVPDYKPRYFVSAKSAVSSLMRYKTKNLGRKTNPDKSKPRAYVKRASQATGAPPSKRLVTRRKKALTAPAGYFPNPSSAMMTAYQVICMHPKKHVVGVFKTMAEAKQIATAMANAKGVAYGVKTVKVHKAHFAA